MGAILQTYSFPIEAYLDRIGIPAKPAADVDGLRAIHRAQAFSVPFENFDIHLGRPLSLDPAALVGKIVHGRRGGYCFEVNGLLHLALEALGFAVRPRLARVLYGRPDAGPRTHQVLLVTIDGQDWIADAGFGGPGLRAVLPLTPGHTSELDQDRFRVRADSGLGFVVEKEADGAWVGLYAFQDETTVPLDILVSNFFTENFPASPFRQRRIAAILKPWGRVTLADMDLVLHRDGRAETIRLEAGPMYMEALGHHFGIETGADYGDLAPLPACAG